jgi:hypothetical protein
MFAVASIPVRDAMTPTIENSSGPTTRKHLQPSSLLTDAGTSCWQHTIVNSSTVRVIDVIGPDAQSGMAAFASSRQTANSPAKTSRVNLSAAIIADPDQPREPRHNLSAD